MVIPELEMCIVAGMRSHQDHGTVVCQHAGETAMSEIRSMTGKLYE